MALHSLPRAHALAACLLGSLSAQAASLTAQLAAESALLGLQLAAHHQAARGRLPAAQNACLQALQPSEYFETTEQVVAAALSPAERAEAEAFLASDPGRKYGRKGLLAGYAAVGVTPPEPMPEFTDADTQAIETFAATRAGRALVGRQVLQAPAAQEAYARRTAELVARCKAASAPPTTD